MVETADNPYPIILWDNLWKNGEKYNGKCENVFFELKNQKISSTYYLRKFNIYFMPQWYQKKYKIPAGDSLKSAKKGTS